MHAVLQMRKLRTKVNSEFPDLGGGMKKFVAHKEMLDVYSDNPSALMCM